ncbi:hypothetical protein [Halodesulfovibrio sp. MK-HDV]|jgi:1-aminocyclopropane-1-carboxylate deaminase/D-cysteine desulfhydrase-like pyridoxal-dependent ACC family enzyme|uniref:hypothetical protein n=1 Tax=Halodesulfovibrio sp. MK-HDV TaxID=2599925 RepID=UPI0013693C7B|nr:hypothetical protein [Halodesulfovibrio sp. MK-HDV]KAF1076304.1 hypothetical protein MKHDV_01325 [Halodesulfovibrio sp. MK-HDV]
MELQEFIKETLTQIAKGVSDAQSDINEAGGILNPANPKYGSNNKSSVVIVNGQQHPIRRVDFDIAITASSKTGTEAGGKLKVWSIGVDATTEKKDTNETVSRVKFAIDICPPVDNTTCIDHSTQPQKKKRLSY